MSLTQAMSRWKPLAKGTMDSMIRSSETVQEVWSNRSLNAAGWDIYVRFEIDWMRYVRSNIDWLIELQVSFQVLDYRGRQGARLSFSLQCAYQQGGRTGSFSAPSLSCLREVIMRAIIVMKFPNHGLRKDQALSRQEVPHLTFHSSDGFSCGWATWSRKELVTQTDQHYMLDRGLYQS